MKKRAIDILLIIFAIIFLASAGMVTYHYVSRAKAERDFEKISISAPPPVETVQPEPTPEVIHDSDVAAKEYLLSLRLQNPHATAFLTIADTQMHYPVMYTPDSPEYYLRRNFEGGYSYYGTPFFDTRCKDPNVKIIYGHHIKGEKMFGELINYNNRDFLLSHETVHLYTENGDEIYRVIASLYTDDDDLNKIYKRAITGLYTEQDYNAYIQDVLRISSAKNDAVTTAFGDELLLLSTCEYSKQDGRFVVVCVK